MTAWCVTADIPQLRTCTVKGVHVSHCDGYEKRYDPATGQTRAAVDKEWNPDTDSIDEWLRPCGGCMPREAVEGRLCASHVAKIGNTFQADAHGSHVVVDLVTHLWSIHANGSAMSEPVSGGAPGSRWTLAESRIAGQAVIDALLAYTYPRQARTMQSGATVEDVNFAARAAVARWSDVGARLHRHAAGAERAVALIAAEQAALRRFSLHEPDHPVQRVRCPACGRIELVWKPPLAFEDDVIVRCSACGNTESQEWLETAIAVLAHQRKANR